MASITSPTNLVSSSRPTHTPSIMYDVFLSFRGEDTRHTFTDHLYHALTLAGLRTFRDNDEIDRGQVLKPEIEAAIIESRACIVVLSENYANSTWCLDELCLILERRRQVNLFVLPIFYHVDPSDVRNQRRSFTIERTIWTSLGNFTIGFSYCLACLGIEAKDGSKWTEVNVRQWKAALTEVANLTGLELSGFRSETNFITEVVETVQRKIVTKQLSTPAHLTGMEPRVELINSWFRNKQHNVIAICGMGGSGKTTLAQYVYNLHKEDFQSSSFIEVTGKQADGLLGLQKQLLRDAFGGKKIRISSISEGTHKIEEVLQTKSVLIVLDDVDRHEQLGVLLGTKVFATESKIIITTRLLDLHAWFGSISWRCWEHELKLLNDLESLELLSWHAFGSKTPMEGFEELAVGLAQYCGGNPLALKVLGSSLFVKDEDPSTINSMIKIWRSRMNSLNSLKGDIDSKIQGVLQKSFDSLPLPSHKELFLHISCFFVGEYVRIVEMILEDECYAISGILTLTNRCLLTISPDRKLIMHQLLQEMGRKVVYEENKDPAKRSRVWHDNESYHLLRKGDGSDTIEGLALDMRKVEQSKRSETLTLKTSSLVKMDKLKLLQLKYVKLTATYKNFPELIWLCWHGFPLQSMPAGLLMSSLVVIDLTDGHLEKFEVPTVLNSLKKLKLKGCIKLVSICNLYRLPKLESLTLWNCSSLTHLCESIVELENLMFLDLKGCSKLRKYVNQSDTMMLQKQPLLSLPRSLRQLDLENCYIEYNNDVFVALHAQSSLDLYMGVNPFEYMPSNINFKLLQILSLYSCTNLKSLPCIPSTLVELHIDWCTSLEKVTFQSGRFSLQGFAYECCFKLFEVQGLFKFVPVAKLDEAYLGHMKWIKAYENHKLNLVGDDITKGRIWHTQVIYEYGIMSTYLQGIKDYNMPTYEYTSSSDFLSFHVHERNNNKIRGLNVSCLYRSSVSKDTDKWVLLAKISNTTKGLTWIYNPVVYCKPTVDEEVLWLCYWPIGNILYDGDEVTVDFFCQKGTVIVSGCGASIVYMDSEVNEEEQNIENNLMKEEEVIGGDLSGFEVITGAYYLCRRDLFGSETSHWLKWMFGDHKVHYSGSRGWRKAHESVRVKEFRDYLNTFPRIILLRVGFNTESEIINIEKAVFSLAGVESVSADHKEMGKLIVVGYVDPIEVTTCVREFDKLFVEIVSAKIVFDKRHT